MLVGNGLDFKMGRALKYPRLPHNRLLMALAHGRGGRARNGKPRTRPQPLATLLYGVK